MSHTLIVLPDDTIRAILEPINAAKRSLNIRMFLFTEPTLLQAVIAAHQRGHRIAHAADKFIRAKFSNKRVGHGAPEPHHALKKPWRTMAGIEGKCGNTSAHYLMIANPLH